MTRMTIRGSVYKRSNGRWTAQSPEIYDPRERRIRRISLGTFDTRGDAEEALRRFHDEYDNAFSALTASQTMSMQLEEYLDSWLTHIQKRKSQGRMAARTVSSHESAIRLHIKPRLGGLRIGQINELVIDDWLTQLRDEGLADRTVLRLWRTLHRSLADSSLSPNPARLPRYLRPTVRQEKKIYRPAAEEIHTFLNHTEDCPRSEYLHPLWRLAAVSGMRRGELVALTWDDLDLRQKVLTVERSIVMDGRDLIVKAPKSKAGIRSLGLDRETVELLARHRSRLVRDCLHSGSDYETNPLSLDLAFRWNPEGTLCRPDRVSSRFVQEWRHAGLTTPATLHSLRHSLGSLLLASGHSITETAAQLGHEPHVLLAIYARDLDVTRRNARVVSTVEKLFG